MIHETAGISRTTARTVVAFGSLVELSAEERELRIGQLASADPDLAARLARLLEHAVAETRVITDFGTIPRQPAARPPVRRAGDRLGDFELVERIGEGGMGEVWKARQSNPARDVAIKIAKGDLPVATALLGAREQRVLAALRHPGIAAIHASGLESDGTSWIAMEYVEGARDLVGFARDRPVLERIALVADVADAIAHAHAAGFIHRDLKPSNVLVGADGRPRVIDFGIAAEAAASEPEGQLLRLGTPGYMPPEALDPDPMRLDARADVYALGAILHEVVHGSLPEPLASGDPLDALLALRRLGSASAAHATPRAGDAAESTLFVPPVDAPRRLRSDLAAIVRQATARTPERRYRTIAAFADDVRAFLAYRPVAASRAGPLRRSALVARRNPIASGFALLAGLAVVAGITASLAFAFRARQAAIDATAIAALTNGIHDIFFRLILPREVDAGDLRTLTMEEYVEGRVSALEKLAGEPMQSEMLGGLGGFAHTLQYTCLSLGLLEQAERCTIVREIVEARMADPNGSLASARHLDAAYVRLARNPADPAALATLDAILPVILDQHRIVRAAPLSQIGGIQLLYRNVLSDEMASRLVEHAAGSNSILLSAVAHLTLPVEEAVIRGDALTEREKNMLRRGIAILRTIAQGDDPQSAAEARSIAVALDAVFSANLAIRDQIDLAEPLYELAILSTPPTPRGDSSLGFSEGVPIRLVQVGALDACAAALEAIDAIVARDGLRLEFDDAVACALARRLLARATGRFDPRAAAEVQALASAELPVDPAIGMPDAHAAAIVAFGEDLAEAGAMEALDALIARTDALAAASSERLVRWDYEDAARVLVRIRASSPPLMPPVRETAPAPTPQAP